MAIKDSKDKDVPTHRDRLHLGEDKDDKILNGPAPTPLPSVPAPGLPLYLADAVREWDPNKPATKDVPKDAPKDVHPPIEVYLAEHVQARIARPDRWKGTVIQTLVNAGIYRPAHDDNPEAAVNDLMAWSAIPTPHEAVPELEGKHR